MVKILGHRGVKRHQTVDENSLSAFGIALTTADGLETDVRLSSSGTPFLAHNNTQAGASHPLDKLADAEIDQLRLKKGSAIPRLTELFNLAAQHPGKILDIELKSLQAVEPVIDEINKAVTAGKITKDRIILTSFDPAAVQQAQQLEPSIRRGFIFYRFNKKTCRELASGIKPDYLISRSGSVTVKNIQKMRQHSPAAKMMFWTRREKPPEKNRSLIKKLSHPEIGPYVEAVITDYPEQMVKFLKKTGLKP